MKQLNTPILFLTFNRPDLAQRVFDEIKKAQPKQLFWVNDGPRNEKEGELAKKTRAIIKQIDWNCEVKTNFSDKNLGCKIRVSSGIDWFFENVEQGIILEDDCLPSQSFFPFCEELLNKYKGDERIMHITGDNFQFNHQRGEADYYFSKYCHIWGWATWKRAWKYYDVKITDFPEFKRQNIIKTVFKNKRIQNKMINIFDDVFNNKIDTWDYQWVYTVWKQKGLAITPNTNLISNIGFRKDATHAIGKNNTRANIPIQEINFPLTHPVKIEKNKKADNYINKYFLLKSKNKFIQYIETFLKNILKKLKLFDFTKKIYLKFKKI
jgi:hypothetical protein